MAPRKASKAGPEAKPRKEDHDHSNRTYSLNPLLAVCLAASLAILLIVAGTNDINSHENPARVNQSQSVAPVNNNQTSNPTINVTINGTQGCGIPTVWGNG